MLLLLLLILIRIIQLLYQNNYKCEIKKRFSYINLYIIVSVAT